MAITFERLIRFENFFNFVFTECFAIYYRKQHYNCIKSKEDMAFENIYYAISRKLVDLVRFNNCFHQHIQRPWFQDNFFINVRKLIFIKKFSAE